MVLRRTLATVLTAAALLLAPAAAGAAAPTKAQVLLSWTQTTATSTQAWNAARLDRGPWESYGFDWTTDYCSSSPDNPLGFDFTLSCWHHDFGYRNYKDLGTFDANKARLDDMFYADLKRECATYSVSVQAACYSLAWIYYQAVSIFGSLEAVNPSDVDRTRALVG
ncbi:phospholipase [Symbioplanes lichenis]|uniref:phospholipase n=1 Tax=Symbioplanes lichenis TaxID=1629072 RepID=UPI0027385B01|nr:phospholipase [Actinoplanes lichenis]